MKNVPGSGPEVAYRPIVLFTCFAFGFTFTHYKITIITCKNH